MQNCYAHLQIPFLNILHTGWIPGNWFFRDASANIWLDISPDFLYSSSSSVVQWINLKLYKHILKGHKLNRCEWSLLAIWSGTWSILEIITKIQRADFCFVFIFTKFPIASASCKISTNTFCVLITRSFCLYIIWCIRHGIRYIFHESVQIVLKVERHVI